MEVNDIVLFDFDAFISGSKDIDYQEAIKKMSLSLMKFLIENDLLVDINPFNQDGSVKKDLIIKKSNLTDEGFQLFVKPVNNWWNALDRGTPPEKVTILENGLKKNSCCEKVILYFQTSSTKSPLPTSAYGCCSPKSIPPAKPVCRP